MLKKGDKPRALLALRRRKYQETLLQKTDAQLETLEQLTTTIEFSLVQKDVLYGLQQGNAVLKEIHREMTLESVEKLVDETAEGVRYQKEVSQMLAGAMSNEEEDEVEDELERLEREARGEVGLPAAPQMEPLPSVPTKTGKAERAKARAKARREEFLQSSDSRQEPALAA
jgi:charged multivesicular body protein 6